MDLDKLEFETGVIRHPLPRDDATALIARLPGWTIEALDPPRLRASFAFKDYEKTMAFVNGVAGLAEKYDHHPSMTVDYGRVEVCWWTHTAGGIAANDFFMARETTGLKTPD